MPAICGKIVQKLKKMKSKKNEDKMVGVFMPSHFLNYLGLYVIFTGVTKAIPLRTAFYDWIKKSTKELPEKKLIESVVKKYQNEWDALKTIENDKMTVDEAFIHFKNKIAAEMAKKEVDTKVCRTILKKLKI